MTLKRLLVLCLILSSVWCLYAEKNISNEKVSVYYFFWNPRCYSCNKIEELSRVVVLERFKEEIKQGKLIWKPVNVKEKKNSHYLKKYGLYTKSLVLVTETNGKEQSFKYAVALAVAFHLRKRKGGIKKAEDHVAKFMGILPPELRVIFLKQQSLQCMEAMAKHPAFKDRVKEIMKIAT